MSRAPVTTSWANAAGERFQILGWPKPGAKAGLLIHHGLGEHAGRYQSLAVALADTDVSVWAFDARGHGASVGKRGDADGLEAFATDLQSLLPEITKLSGHDHMFVMGHSMGAAALAWYATTRLCDPVVRGMVFSAPPLAPNLSTSVKLKLAAAKGLKMLTPRLTLASELPADGISSDPAEVTRYLADPMVHDRISVRLALSLVYDAQKILDHGQQLTLPTLVLHGMQDPIALPKGGRDWFAAIGAEDKTLETFDNMRHEMHHEVDRKQFFSVLTTWLDRQLAALPAVS